MTALAIHGTLRKAIPVIMVLFAAASVVSIAASQTLYALALLAWAADLAARREPPVKSGYEWFFAAFVVLGVISALSAIGDGAWMPFLKRVVLIPVVYLTAGAVRGRGALKAVSAAIVTAGVVFSLIGIVKFLTGPDDRLRLFNHYMTSGGILMIVALFTFSFAIVPSPGRIRAGALAGGCIVLVPLVMTFTRSSWLGLAAGLGVMCLMAARKIFPFLVIALVALVAVAPQGVRERALSSFDPRHSSNIERTYMWKAGIEMMRDHPLTGTGDIDLSELYMEYRPPEAKQVHGHMHNNLIMIGAIMGLPGLLLFVSMFAFIFFDQVRTFRKLDRGDWALSAPALAAAGVMAGFQVNGLFEWNFGDSEIITLVWITAGLCLAAGRAAVAGETGGEER